VSRKLIDTTNEATKFTTSPENDIDRFEEENYNDILNARRARVSVIR
jgi:hypothetical protein